MLTVQYKGKGERTVGTQVVYPGELLHPTATMLAAWQAELGDVFAVVGGGPVAPEPETQPEGDGAPAQEPAKGRKK